MNMSELMEQMKSCAIFFYQNKEEDAYRALGGLLPYINTYLQNKASGTTEEDASMVLSQMQSLIEAYQRRDQLALADWLYIETLSNGGVAEELLEDIAISKDLPWILEENKKALYEAWGEDYAKYDAYKIDDISNYCLEGTLYGEAVLGVMNEGYEYRLNSIYHAGWAAEQYAKRYEDVKDYSVIGILGLSDGTAIRNFLRNCNSTNTIIIYEPDAKLFSISMQQFYLADILQRSNVYLVVEGINGERLNKWVDSVISYQTKELLVQCILPNYDVLYPNGCTLFIDKMIHNLKQAVFNKNTEILHATKFGDNLFKNMSCVLKQSSITILKKYVKSKGYADGPAIIVSAGPSLDKNIQDLKKADGKAFIIGVDSALKALTRENIHIQLAISVDPNKNPQLFEEEKLNDLPYVVSSFSLPIITKKNRNRLFFDGGYGFDIFETLINEKTGKKVGTLKSGGSVATDAFSLMVDMGFKNIILVGQDLAFTGGQDHVSGFARSEANEREERMLQEVEGYNGEPIKTDHQMAYYKEWFETEIRNLDGKVNVIDATEGGAKIIGTKTLSLSEAIETYCKKEVDFDKIIADVPYLFTQEEESLIRNELLQTGQRLLELEDRLCDGIAVYDELIQMEREERQKEPRYKELLERLIEINRMEETERYIDLARMYAKEVEYNAAEDIYTAEDLSVSEIAQRGKALLEGYLQGAKICGEQVRNIMIPELETI